jgi:hypothetical protein
LDGTEILKLLNEDGKIFAEAAAVLLQTMIPEDVFPGLEAHQAKAVDGMAILKDIQKHQKKAGETGNSQAPVLTVYGEPN